MHNVFSNKETALLVTVNADKIGEGPCPKLGSGNSS